MKRTIPENSVSGVVTFDILSEGKVINPATQIISIVVSKEVNRVPIARIVIKDGSTTEEDWEVSNLDLFEPGKKIEIKAGRDGKNDSIFKGIVVKQRIKSSEFANSTLQVECKDESVKLTVGRKNRYFENSKDSDILSKIIKESGLKADIEATKVKHKEMVQHHSIDWDFILARAAANSLLVMPDDGKIIAKKPNSSSKPVVELLYGATMYAFEAELNAQEQWKAVEGKSWDYAKQSLFEAKGSKPAFKDHGNLSGDKLSDVLGLKKLETRHTGHVVQEELKAWTDACLQKSRLSKIVGQCRFDGQAKVKPGTVIKLGGVGKRFNGNAYVTGVHHELAEGNWFTNAQFGLASDWSVHKPTITEEPAGGLLPGIHGLQVAKVVQLEKDPDGEDRILVKLPIIDNAAKGIWARVASLDAGKKRGWYFRPEIDDEVVVGFLNADPRDAIVLGMLHSSKNPAPIVAKDVNHEKGLVTRSEIKVLFDDEKKIITIETPAKNSIVISEEDKSIVITDQNKNKIEMADIGITMSSLKDITLDAKGKINIKAAQDVAMEGLNVNIKAKAQLAAKGTAGAEFSASGQTIVKGAMVMIN
ncbi:MAG: type VI secretion system tip protein VgrG [Bacteroidota bacterium]